MSMIASGPVLSQPALAPRGVYNFSAGPGCLPEEVLLQAREDIWNLMGSGFGIMEHSHRGKTFDKVLAEAEADCRKIANIPANYKILFLTGGATAQNWMVPMNLLPQGGTADYVTTGYWAQKSFEHAKPFGAVREAFSSKSENFKFVPQKDSEIAYDAKAAYAHYTSNNTIMGTEFHWVPTPPKGVPLVCDMSSDIFAGPLDVTKFGLIYAGAQKNLGTAGTTVVIVHEDLAKKKVRENPEFLRYETFAANESRPNTPPTFNIYLTGQVFKWILRKGGLEPMAKFNAEKAKLIYDAVDGSGGFYKGHARPDSRSLMNITFRLPTEELDTKFISEAAKQGMVDMKGHRSTGGVRASVYNAMPRAGCVKLVDFMKEFMKKNG